MKKQMKKWIVMIMAVALILTAVGGNGIGTKVAKAAVMGDYEYDVLSNGTVEITYYDGYSTSVVIPSQIDGKTVTSIGDYAFEDVDLKSVTIPIVL